jgi:hypothetical protein
VPAAGLPHWKLDGRRTYLEAEGLLICADAGGSSGTGYAPGKFPVAPGGSDLNTDHRLSLSCGDEQMEQERAPAILVHQSELEGRATRQLRDDHQPLGGTKTCTGLQGRALLDTNDYQTGIKALRGRSVRGRPLISSLGRWRIDRQTYPGGSSKTSRAPWRYRAAM